MDRAEAAAAPDRRTHHQRHAALLVRDVPELRGLVDEAVHRQAHEVAEHHLEHRTQAGDRGAVRGAGERELGDRRVEHPLGPEPLQQIGGHLEHPAGRGDVLAEEHDGGVALELLGERVADRVSELERRSRPVLGRALGRRVRVRGLQGGLHRVVDPRPWSDCLEPRRAAPR